MAFPKSLKSYALTNLFTTDADANRITSSQVTYQSLNGNVAQVDASTGYLRFVNDGWTTVQATSTSDNNTAYYVAYITTAEVDPTDYVSGNVLDLSNPKAEGEIDATSVKLPYLTIGIGSSTETAVLKNLGTSSSPRYGIVCLDANGFNHAYAPTAGTPTMGTYFSLTPSASGTLTVKGYFNTNGGGTNPAKLYLEGAEKATIAFDATAEQTLSLKLEAGKTYYLYVPTSDGNYDYFCPNYISYVSGFYFQTKQVTVANGAKSYTQQVMGKTGKTTYAVTAKGAITGAAVDKSGKVTWSVDQTKGDGGALVVTATDNGSSDFYVITVPYTTHTWSFIDPVPSWTTMQQNTTDWQLFYKVRQYTNGSLTYLNTPYVSNATALDGINAYYMDETAGLLIKAGAQAFGSDVTDFIDPTSYQTDEARLHQPYTNVKAVTKLTLKERSTLTIPQLKKGQYVRMRWLRYSSQTGDLVTVTNLTDLEGASIDKAFRIGSRQGGSTKKGYQEFIVAADGDVTFSLQYETGGYVDIEEIAVSDKMLPTDLTMTPNTYYYPSGQATTLTLKSSGYTSSLSPLYYSVSKKEGSNNFSFEFTDGTDQLTVSSGQGILTVTAKAKTVKDSRIRDTQDIGSYVLDEATAPITVLAQATTSQTYPYTWDFKKYNSSHFSAMTTTSGSASDLWTAKTADNSEKIQYTLNRNSWDCVSGDELRDANGQAVAEAQGLGFTATRGSSSTLVYRTGDDIKFDGADADILHIPTVPTGATVYMLIKVNTGGTVTVDGTSLSGTDVATTTISSGVQEALGINGQKKWKLYTIVGANKTIDVALANVQLRMVAVTNIFKTFNHLEGMDKSYATEYRDQAERYELSELFTNGASPVTAHIVSAVSDNLATASEVAVAPKYTGVILSTSNLAEPTNVPLFVPDINTQATSQFTNYLKGVLSDSKITPSEANVNYIFTPYYYKVNESGSATTGKQAGTLAFYRQLNGDNTTLGAHKAYLQISRSVSSKQYIFISSIANGALPSAIRIPQDVPGDDGVYYTLGGQRLQRQPVRSGVYIRNGKKIIVKQK